MTSFFKQKRIEDKKYLDSFRYKRCCVCGNPNSVAHHIRFNNDCGTALKPNDSYCIALCDRCHKECHRGEQRFYDKYEYVWNSNVLQYARDLYKQYKNKG